MTEVIGAKAMEDFLEELGKLADAASDTSLQAVLMTGATAMRDDVRKLPKPRQNINKATHMLDLVDAEYKDKAARVGWVKEGYYGAFVERGTKFLKRTTPHIGPTWNNNKNRYLHLMADKFFKKGGL